MTLYALTIAYYKSDRFYTKIRYYFGKISPSTYEMKVEYTVENDDQIDFNSRRTTVASNFDTIYDIQNKKVELEEKGRKFTVRSEDESHNPVRSGKKLRIEFDYKSTRYDKIDQFFSETSEIVRETIKLLEINAQDEEWVFKAKIEGGEFLGSHLRNLEDRDVNEFLVDFDESEVSLSISSDTLTAKSTESEKINKILDKYIRY